MLLLRSVLRHSKFPSPFRFSIQIQYNLFCFVLFPLESPALHDIFRGDNFPLPFRFSIQTNIICSVLLHFSIWRCYIVFCFTRTILFVLSHFDSFSLFKIYYPSTATHPYRVCLYPLYPSNSHGNVLTTSVHVHGRLSTRDSLR